ncbi:MAG: D-Ala-D-Ala carboxypeptidase family metallohydrolase [Candidatus Micrarchaeia archaeon]
MKTTDLTYKYFTPEEFAKCIPACCIEDLEPLLLEILNEAREKAGIPFVIRSAYRSVEYERSKGRTGYSSHCNGLAVDIKCNDSIDRLKIVRALLDTGFTRIGIYENFIHVDIDDTKPACMWYGANYNL